MSTSGSTNWELTRDEIIKEAYSLIEIGVEGESLDPDQIVQGKRAFNSLLKHLQTRGMNLWLRDTQSITLVADTVLYTLGATGGTVMVRPLRIIECNRKDSTGAETSMTALGREEYENLPNKTNSGVPVDYYYEPTLVNGRFSVWPQPTSTDASEYTIEIVFQTEVEDMDSSTDTMDFPKYWTRTITYLLACDLAPRNGVNMHDKYYLKRMADEALEDALAFDTEITSVFLQPDYRG